MKTSVIITRLVEAARNPHSDPNKLAALLSQGVERIAGMSPNGPEALAILHNKFMRKGLDTQIAFGKRANGKPTVAYAEPQPRKKFSAATRAKISASQKQRWAEFHRRKKEQEKTLAAKSAAKKTKSVSKKSAAPEKKATDEAAIA
jgi:hypothetical protein